MRVRQMMIALAVVCGCLAVLTLFFVIRSISQSRRKSANLVFTDEQGRKMSPEDLSDFTGTVNWSIAEEKNVPESAQELLDRGRQAGANGQHEEALRLFAESAKIAPHWAYPVYEAAFTHLLMGNLENAEGDYARLEKLEPRGFFTYQSELDCVRRERGGEFEPDTCRTYILLADMPASAQKRALLQKLLEGSPTLAPAWEKYAQLCDTDEEKMAAIEKGLASRPDRHTRGTLLINKALILDRRGKHDEAMELLNSLVSAPDSSLDTVTNARYAISHLKAHTKR